MASTSYPRRRKYVRVFESANGTVNVVNYCADNNSLNEFLHNFDAWNGYGRYRLSAPMKCEGTFYQEVWFEMPIDFMDFAKTNLFKLVMERFDVEILYGYDTIYNRSSETVMELRRW